MSSPPLRVFLTREQDRMLLELRKVDGVPQCTKDRAQVIRLSSMGWKVKKIAAYLHWRETTVRTALHRWIAHGKRGLVG
jgi:DNA-binding NarL/FixJ family response regulator